MQYGKLNNAIRFLSMDAIEAAKSGHPGAPMGMAEMAGVLWRKFLKHNPNNPNFFNRDRFVLSNGHASMLLYSLLHLTGYALSIEDLKQFRQLRSKTPGHPEYGYTPGVETTTGPLGQGLANAVGMALAEKILAAEFNREGFPLIDHYTYAFVGDGCMMEGISHEVCSLAGTLGLEKLIVLYDDNHISIDGDVRGWFDEDVAARFRAYGWHVIAEVDGHDEQQIQQAIEQARKAGAPSLICCQTKIGKGSAQKEGSAKTHGAPLGESDIQATRQALDWPYPPFEIPDEVYRAWDARSAGEQYEKDWQDLYEKYKHAYPEEAAELQRRIDGKLPADFDAYIEQSLLKMNEQQEKIATRKASQNSIAILAARLPELVGGSADLTPSNLTDWSGSKPLSKAGGGNYLHYGVREFGMSAIMNGMALHGGLRPFGATFLMFSEYARNALRMAALMRINPIFVYTHDSIGLGEDGPTHQPVEQLATLRLMPNMNVWRPCDSAETLVAWAEAIKSNKRPTALVFSRHNLPYMAKNDRQLNEIARGAYVLCDTAHPQAVVIATGSEVSLAKEALSLLKEEGFSLRLVSMPCQRVFDEQSVDYRDQVLLPELPKIVVEAGATDGWYRYVGSDGLVIGLDQFGESAPADALFHEFGFTPKQLAQRIEDFLLNKLMI